MHICFICQTAISASRPGRVITNIMSWGVLYEAEAHKLCMDELSGGELTGMHVILRENLHTSMLRGMKIGVQFLDAARKAQR